MLSWFRTDEISFALDHVAVLCYAVVPRETRGPRVVAAILDLGCDFRERLRQRKSDIEIRSLTISITSASLSSAMAHRRILGIPDQAGLLGTSGLGFCELSRTVEYGTQNIEPEQWWDLPIVRIRCYNQCYNQCKQEKPDAGSPFCVLADIVDVG